MTVKINISLPDETFNALERAAKERHTTRSGFLGEAALAHIKHLEEIEAAERLRHVRKEAAEVQDQIREAAGKYDAGSALRKWRDSRK